jgi:hypothetical protein
MLRFGLKADADVALTDQSSLAMLPACLQEIVGALIYSLPMLGDGESLQDVANCRKTF